MSRLSIIVYTLTFGFVIGFWAGEHNRAADQSSQKVAQAAATAQTEAQQ